MQRAPKLQLPKPDVEGRGAPRLVLLAGICAMALGASLDAARADDRDNDRHRETATRIKRVVVVLGENRGFDHIYGVYKPRNGQRIDNLLTRGIVDEKGRPGPNFRAAAQST